MRENSLLYFRDKHVSRVSGVWKALHISIYTAIALTAFITSMSAGNMFQTFKYNCILYCTNISFVQETVPKDIFVEQHPIDLKCNTPQEDEIVLVVGNDTMFEYTDNETDFTSANITIDNNTSVKNNVSPKKKDDTFLFRNETLIYECLESDVLITYAKIDERKSILPNNFWCNFVLGTALITFIFATFCIIILAMCSKGGKGVTNTLNRPQNMIYPIIVSSLVLVALNIISSIVIKNGIQNFCASFEMFTGQESCSPLINHFTTHTRQWNFYLPYAVLSYSFNLTIILIASQIVVTSLRVIYAVDYQLYSVDEDYHDDDNNEFEVEDGKVVMERQM